MEDEKIFGTVISQEEHQTDDTVPDSGSGVGEESKVEYHQKDIQSPTESDVSDNLSPIGGSDDSDSLEQIEGRLKCIADTEQRLFSEVREMHRLYHAEFAGRLKAMQDELEEYRKIDKGRVFDDILAAIARIYENNETLVDEVTEPKAKKSIQYMLMDIEDLLAIYGVTKLHSEVGVKRNPRHCQVLNRISTDDPEKHDTVAKSYNAGFYIGNRTVIKEMVDIYIYNGAGTKSVEKARENSIIETDDSLVAE